MNHRIGRRGFLQAGAAVAAASLGGGRVAPAAERTVPMIVEGESGADPQTCREAARDIPVVAEADVVVCGGGPAGVAAAVAAARRGARTHLLELHGCLGGIWTAGALSWLLDWKNKKGVMRELVERLKRRDALTLLGGAPTNAYDVEAMKITLEEMCIEAGVRIQLHTRVCAAAKDPQGRLAHVVTESKSGREALAGKTFIDCTGDGDLGAAAGCGFDLGHPETARTQPMSLMALLAGIRADEVAPFISDEFNRDWAGPKDRLRGEMERGGHSPSYSKPTLFRIRDDLFSLMANHEYEVKGVDARDVTRATLQARREVHRLIDGLRGLGGVWRDVRVVATSAQIGVREGRRIRGLYTVSTDDLREGRRHEDGICLVTFGIDVHSTDPTRGKGIEGAAFRAKPYDIPLRALVARDVEGLMMAGRCISGDFIAHSSYRVTGNAAATGEAAGVTAALAAGTDRLPREVSFDEVRAAIGEATA
jgi:hypothetical protein